MGSGVWGLFRLFCSGYESFQKGLPNHDTQEEEARPFATVCKYVALIEFKGCAVRCSSTSLVFIRLLHFSTASNQDFSGYLVAF